ncbi:MAG: hypothetical protein KKH61_21655, partial [Gammaproteobacteria bacterium]|nr:hypothetical protein [Gammaproteobacteria bacterium]
MALQSRIDRAENDPTTLAGYFADKPLDLYRLLWAYYGNNDLYAVLRSDLAYVALEDASIKALENPAMRAVEFYPAKLWPGVLPAALPIETENEAIIEPIQQVWKWSNWAARKQVFARYFACLGDGLLKVAQAGNGESRRVYLQVLDPRYLTDFVEEERGYLTYIRLDAPLVKRDAAGKATAYTRTEVWDKGAGTYRVWEHQKDAGEALERLPAPTETRQMAEFGVDFIPIVHAKFRDIGDPRGVGCFTAALDKIDEANRMVTRLHQMLFRHNRVTWALEANATGPDGRPLPPPVMPKTANDEVELGGDQFLALPGNARLVPLVPTIHYEAALAILQDYMLELEKDLPELAYYRLRQMGDLSGRAVKLLLSDAVDRALEARGNAEAALIRADEMALTIGSLTIGSLPALWDVGRYEQGAFDHAFTKRDIFPLTEQEMATTALDYTRAGVPLATACARVGWDDSAVA